MLCLVTPVVSDSLQPHGLYPARLFCPWDFPGKNTGVSCHFLLQGIFPTQELNPGLLQAYSVRCLQLRVHKNKERESLCVTLTSWFLRCPGDASVQLRCPRHAGGKGYVYVKEKGVFLVTERDRSDLGSLPGTDVCEHPQMQGVQMWILFSSNGKFLKGLESGIVQFRF